MTEKYIDLKTEIIRMRDSFEMKVGIVSTLNWLDEHPDLVPGRTSTDRVKITGTEAYELYQSARSFSLDDFKVALESIDGIETVDDPEPTNADQIIDLLCNAPANLDRRNLGIWLDKAGVKAPGSDDEQR